MKRAVVEVVEVHGGLCTRNYVYSSGWLIYGQVEVYSGGWLI